MISCLLQRFLFSLGNLSFLAPNHLENLSSISSESVTLTREDL